MHLSYDYINWVPVQSDISRPWPRHNNNNQFLSIHVIAAEFIYWVSRVHQQLTIKITKIVGNLLYSSPIII